MEITLNSIAPSASITKWFRQEMEKMMDEMRHDIVHDVIAPYRSELAMDGILDWMGHVMDSLIDRWQGRLNKMSDEIAQELINKSKTHYDRRLINQLRKRGFTANFRPTKQMQDEALIALGENTALIKSIGTQYLDKVRSAIWRSTKDGYDIEGIIKQLRHIDGVEDRRAKNIAKDQVAKLNQAFEDARAKELGITKAKWLHSSAVKVPRPSHVKANGTIYEIEKGLFLDGEWVKPTQKIGCKCRKYLVIDIP